MYNTLNDDLLDEDTPSVEITAIHTVWAGVGASAQANNLSRWRALSER